MKLEIFDAGCGLGGWTDPFIDRGHHVIGLDCPRANTTRKPSDNKDLEMMIRNYYRGDLIFQDIRTFDATHLRGKIDFVIGSMPCRDFSSACQSNRIRKLRSPPDPSRGLGLIEQFMRVVEEIKPKFWAMENVRRVRLFYKEPPIWHFLISQRGHRFLWGNLPLPILPPEFRFTRNLEWDYSHLHFPQRSALRSRIPYAVASFIADCVERAFGMDPTRSTPYRKEALEVGYNVRAKAHKQLQSVRRKALRENSRPSGPDREEILQSSVLDTSSLAD